MIYKVLYRKYRPDCFENIIGQDYIIKTLKNSIINKNISHAYIFSGPRGTGKTSTAKVFSKAINCIQNENGTPCGKCVFCLNFVENPDIIEIDAASNNGVEEIRNLIDNIKLTPTNGNYKVYIIDEVHMLTISAFNALLLTLEEPPKHAIFILATTNIENVPITILSRCQRFDFQKIKIDDIVIKLKEICEKESINIEDNALKEIAYLSEGGLRDALSLLDQLSKNSLNITLDMIENQIKIVSQKNINDLMDYIEQNDLDSFMKSINDYRIRSIDYKSLIKRMIDCASIRAKNIKLTGKFKNLNFSMYKEMVLKLSECLTKININVDPYTILEMVLLEFFDTKEMVLDKDVNKVNNDNEEKDKEIDVTNKEVNDTSIAVEVRINNCFVNAHKKYLEEMRNIIDNYINSSFISGKVKSILLDANVVVASDQYLILTCENDYIANDANKLLQEIETDLEKNANKALKLVFISNVRWNTEKQKYIENLKNNIKYTYIEEKDTTTDDNPEINSVFDISKVEII